MEDGDGAGRAWSGASMQMGWGRRGRRSSGQEHSPPCLPRVPGDLPETRPSTSPAGPTLPSRASQKRWPTLGRETLTPGAPSWPEEQHVRE